MKGDVYNLNIIPLNFFAERCINPFIETPPNTLSAYDNNYSHLKWFLFHSYSYFYFLKLFLFFYFFFIFIPWPRLLTARRGLQPHNLNIPALYNFCKMMQGWNNGFIFNFKAFWVSEVIFSKFCDLFVRAYTPSFNQY